MTFTVKRGHEHPWVHVHAVLTPELAKTDGFLSLEHFTSVASDSNARLLSVISFRDEVAATTWCRDVQRRASRLTAMFREKLALYSQLAKEKGEAYARETMLQGYPERQRRRMAPFIDNATLADGFAAAKPHFQQLGMQMEVLDISNHDVDGVLEVQREC